MEALACKPTRRSSGLRRSATESIRSRARICLNANCGAIANCRRNCTTLQTRSSGQSPIWSVWRWRACWRANLTPRQRYVCEQYLNGWTLQEIGKRMGVTKQAAGKTLKFALIKLKQAWRNNPFHGLAEVYRSETRRVGSRR